jgi:hypothetical protein
VLRLLANLVAIIGLAALGLAIGDFASHPNPVGAIGLILLVVFLGVALRQLYRPGGIASRRPAPAAAPSPPDEPAPRRKRPASRPTSAPLWMDDDTSH